MSNCQFYEYRRHQIYVVYEVEKRHRQSRGLQKHIAAVNHCHLHGIRAVRYVRRLLQLFAFNCRVLHPDKVATSVHNALLFRDDLSGLEDITPITTHQGMGLDNDLHVQVCPDEVVLNQMNDEMITVVDITKEDNVGYCFLNIATGADLGNPILSDIPFCSPLSAEEYAFVHWEEDEEIGEHEPSDECRELLEWYKTQRVLSILDIGEYWPTICHEFHQVHGTGATGGLAPWRDDRPSRTAKTLVPELQQISLQKVVRVFRNRDTSRGHLACIPRSCSLEAIIALSQAKILSDHHIYQFLHLKTVIKEVSYSRCFRVTLNGIKRTIRMCSSWLQSMNVSWLPCVTDDAINIITSRCKNLKLLLANGCHNIKGIDLTHKSLVFMDYGQNLSGLPMDIYVYYKDRRRKKTVLGKLRHNWLFGRAALHFTDRLMKFCSNFEEPMGDYESLERYMKRLLSTDYTIPYFNDKIDIIQESIVPDPLRYLAQFIAHNITPFFLRGGASLTPAGNLSLIIDMSNRDELVLRDSMRSVPIQFQLESLVDMESMFGVIQNEATTVPPRYAFLRVKPGNKNAFDVYTAREYAELFYPEPSATRAKPEASAVAAKQGARVTTGNTTGNTWSSSPAGDVIRQDLKRIRTLFRNYGVLSHKDIAKLKGVG